MATPFEELYDTLAGRMHANWPDLARVKWDDGRRFSEPTTGYYVAFFILDGEGQQISISRVTPLKEWPGIIDLQIFTRIESQARNLEARRQADRLDAIFGERELLTASSYLIRVRNTNFARVGEVGDWMQHNAWLRFTYMAAY